MSPPGRSRLWLLLTPPASFLLLYACGSFGSTDSDVDVADGGSDGSNAADTPDELARVDADLPRTDASPDGAHADADADAAACVYAHATSTSAGGPSMCGEAYTCGDAEVTIECSCASQTCTCRGLPLADASFLCAGSCALTSALRTACGFPAAGGGSSGASSAGGGG